MGLSVHDGMNPIGHTQGMGWREKIEAAIKAKGTDMKAVSLAAGRGETFVRDILKRQNQPRADNLAGVAAVLGLKVSDLLDDAVTIPAPLERKIVYAPNEADVEAVLQQAIDQLVSQGVGPTRWAYPLAQAVHRFLQLEQEAPPRAQVHKRAAQSTDIPVPNKPGRRNQPPA